MQLPALTRQKILKGALTAFSQKGIAGATTREIARLAKVNEVTLFRHFKTKKQLLTEVMASCSDTYDPLFAEAPVETQADVQSTISTFVQFSAKFLHENEKLIRVVMGELSRQPALAKRLFGEASDRKRDLLLKYLVQARERKLIRDDVDLKTAIALLQSMMLGYTLRQPFLEGQVSREDYFKLVVELFMKGISR